MLKLLFNTGRNKIKDALRKGAAIVDVRTVHEYDEGRIPGSIHIPLNRIPTSLERIRGMKKPIVLCSDGDERSGEAARLLRKNGLKEIYDGGKWERLLKLVNDL
ncbi:MAG TPA: rhodanese-like domain-containing protein [Chitinophagaceae bacterium]|nr:rhodanese-like domain-containing protein [Chitinophagaceae bacterium]